MVSILPSETIEIVQRRCPCRQAQIQQLALFYNGHLPPPPLLVAYGLENTGKLKTIVTLLEAVKIGHAVVKSRDCLSQRHLLSKIFAACIRALGQQDDTTKYDRIDSLNSLVVNLQRLMKERNEKFVLVIDGIDKQKGSTYALLPALARLWDEVPILCTIFISTSTQPLVFHRSGTPYIHFTQYSRNEAIFLITSDPPPLQPESSPDAFPTVPATALKKIYTSFVAAVYDTLISPTSPTSVITLRRACEKLWPSFIWPMLTAEPITGRNQSSNSTLAWDFPRLLSRNRSLFQHQGEKALIDTLSTDVNAKWSFNDLIKSHLEADAKADIQSKTSQLSKSKPAEQLSTTITTTLLKFFPTLLLISSYLASHTQPKHDIILFSRLSSSSSHKRRYLSSTLSRGHKIRKTPTKPTSATEDSNMNNETDTPSKKNKRSSKVIAAESGPGPEREKTHKSSRLLFEKTSNIPRPFTLERVIAILRAVHPDGIVGSRGAADNVYGEMSELERLRLVVRVRFGSSSDGVTGGGAGSGGSRGADDGILEEKWRVNVAREVVVEMGRVWSVGIDGWEID